MAQQPTTANKDTTTTNNNNQQQPATRQSNTATKKQCQQDNKTAAIQQNKQEKEEQKEKEEKKMKKGDTSRPNKERKKAESNLRLPSYLLFLAWSISSFSIILSLSLQLLAEWFRFTVADSSSLVWTRQT
jgi:cation transport ATPase